MRQAGDLYACGFNSSGQLGLGHKTHQWKLARVPFDDVYASAEARGDQVACGGHHTFVKTVDQSGGPLHGALFACGNNSNGQLGIGSCDSKAVLTPVKALRASAHEVACGGHHTLILTHSGSLFACGYNAHGRLGLGRGVRGNQLVPQPVALPGGGARAAQVACGWAHSVVRTDDGAVLACGRNNYGALGLGHNANQHTFERVPCPLAAELSCGWGHTWMLSAQGDLYSWGHNANGELGLGSALHQNSPQPVSAKAAMWSMLCSADGERPKEKAPWPLVA